MRRLVYYVACTADRFIAGTDGSTSFFPVPQGEYLADLVREFPDTIPAHVRGPLGVDAPNRRFGAVLMGRRTYEPGLEVGVTSPYPHLRQYVFSRSMQASPDPAVELVSGDPVARVRELKAEEGMDIWLCGGGELAAALFGEIDALILKVNPVVIGEGTPLFAGPLPPTPVALTDSRVYDGGFAVLHYDVKH